MAIIEPERMVTVKYVMTTHLSDGTVKRRPEEVMEFIFGIERQVLTLEKALDGAGIGDRFSIRIPSSEIYGEHDPELILEIPKKGLIKQRIKEGQFYRQMKKGCLVSFKVLEVRQDTLLVDFNKPMAGITVSMDVEFKRSIGCG